MLGMRCVLASMITPRVLQLTSWDAPAPPPPPPRDAVCPANACLTLSSHSEQAKARGGFAHSSELHPSRVFTPTRDPRITRHMTAEDIDRSRLAAHVAQQLFSSATPSDTLYEQIVNLNLRQCLARISPNMSVARARALHFEWRVSTVA